MMNNKYLAFSNKGAGGKVKHCTLPELMNKVEEITKKADIFALYLLCQIISDNGRFGYSLPEQQIRLINEWIQERTVQVSLVTLQ